MSTPRMTTRYSKHHNKPHTRVNAGEQAALDYYKPPPSASAKAEEAVEDLIRNLKTDDGETHGEYVSSHVRGLAHETYYKERDDLIRHVMHPLVFSGELDLTACRDLAARMYYCLERAATPSGVHIPEPKELETLVQKMHKVAETEFTAEVAKDRAKKAAKTGPGA